jgi:hypothetical protein
MTSPLVDITLEQPVVDGFEIYLKSGDTYLLFGTTDKFTEKGAIIAYDTSFSDMLHSTPDIDFCNVVALYYKTPVGPDQGMVINEYTQIPPYDPVITGLILECVNKKC